jgi:hypothetical protein
MRKDGILLKRHTINGLAEGSVNSQRLCVYPTVVGLDNRKPDRRRSRGVGQRGVPPQQTEQQPDGTGGRAAPPARSSAGEDADLRVRAAANALGRTAAEDIHSAPRARHLGGCAAVVSATAASATLSSA